MPLTSTYCSGHCRRNSSDSAVLCSPPSREQSWLVMKHGPIISFTIARLPSIGYAMTRRADSADWLALAGNHIMIRCRGAVVALCHRQHRRDRSVGDYVEPRRCDRHYDGNSGNSSDSAPDSGRVDRLYHRTEQSPCASLQTAHFRTWVDRQRVSDERGAVSQDDRRASGDTAVLHRPVDSADWADIGLDRRDAAETPSTTIVRTSVPA